MPAGKRATRAAKGNIASDAAPSGNRESEPHGPKRCQRSSRRPFPERSVDRGTQTPRKGTREGSRKPLAAYAYRRYPLRTAPVQASAAPLPAVTEDFRRLPADALESRG